MKDAKKDFLEKNLIIYGDFKMFVDLDKTNNKKYVYWMVNNYVKYQDAVQHIIDQVYWHYNMQNRLDAKDKDINKLSMEDIDLMMNDPKYMSKKDIKQMTKSDENYKILYKDNDNNMLIEILNKYGAIYWTHTMEYDLPDASFCIGAHGAGNLYKDYKGKNPIYFIIQPNATNPLTKKIVLTPIGKKYYEYTDMRNITIPIFLFDHPKNKHNEDIDLSNILHTNKKLLTELNNHTSIIDEYNKVKVLFNNLNSDLRKKFNVTEMRFRTNEVPPVIEIMITLKVGKIAERIYNYQIDNNDQFKLSLTVTGKTEKRSIKNISSKYKNKLDIVKNKKDIISYVEDTINVMLHNKKF